MTHATHRGAKRLVGLAVVAVLGLGLVGCGVAGTPEGGPGMGVAPSAGTDEGVGSLGDLPAEVARRAWRPRHLHLRRRWWWRCSQRPRIASPITRRI